MTVAEILEALKDVPDHVKTNITDIQHIGMTGVYGGNLRRFLPSPFIKFINDYLRDNVNVGQIKDHLKGYENTDTNVEGFGVEAIEFDPSLIFSDGPITGEKQLVFII